LIEVPQVEYEPLFLGQFQNGLVQAHLQFVGVDGALLACELIRKLMLHIMDGKHESPSALPEQGQAFVGGYSVDPGEQLTFLAKMLQVVPNLDERVLYRVIRIGVVDDDTPDMLVNALLVLFHQ
ncbi:MAG: hypothetical protein RLZZ630_1346, partial [Bacteroidota bacterium]